MTLQPDYDVVVIGGALSGSATATLLLRKNPGIRILIVDKSEKLGRRVGEATVEVSGYFLGRVLGLTQYLNEAHISKQGLRFWFANDKVTSLDQASEVGPRYLARLPSYQIDRAALDEEVLRRAEQSGATVLRPATISNIRLVPGGMQTMEIKQGDEKRAVSARWIVDASGLAAVLARKEGWWKPTATTRPLPLGRAGRASRIGTAANSTEKYPRLVRRPLRHPRHRHQPHHRRWLVELVDSSQRRRCQRRRRVRPTPRRFPAGWRQYRRSPENVPHAPPGGP